MKITDRLASRERYHTASIDPGTARVVQKPPRQDDAFTRAVSEARQRGSSRPALTEHLEALARPEASDPASYTTIRSIELLQHVVDNVLPSLEADDEIMALAKTVVDEELDWRQAWEARMNEASTLPQDNFTGEENLS